MKAFIRLSSGIFLVWLLLFFFFFTFKTSFSQSPSVIQNHQEWNHTCSNVSCVLQLYGQPEFLNGIDPTIKLNDSNITFNGYVENVSNTFARTSNPRTALLVGKPIPVDEETEVIRRSAIEFNITQIPDNSRILDLTSIQFMLTIMLHLLLYLVF